MRAGIHVSGSFNSIILAARSEGGVAQCPLCGARSRRIHSRYDRLVADLPMQARKYGSASSRGGSFARCLIVGGGFSLNGWGAMFFRLGHAGRHGWNVVHHCGWRSAAGQQRTSATNNESIMEDVRGESAATVRFAAPLPNLSAR